MPRMKMAGGALHRRWCEKYDVWTSLIYVYHFREFFALDGEDFVPSFSVVRQL